MINNMHGLYLVTPNWDDTAKLVACTERALAAGAALVQYRHKQAGAELQREQGAASSANWTRVWIRAACAWAT